MTANVAGLRDHGEARGDDRPRIVPPRTPLLAVLHAVSWAGRIACVVIGALHWRRLPDSIPIHFGFAGEPDAWGPRAWLFAIVLLPALLNLAFAVLGHRPWILGYPIPITRENAAAQYALVRVFLAALGVSIAWFCAWIVWRTVRIALGAEPSLGGWALPAFLAGLAVTIVAYVMAARARREGGPA